MQSSKVANREDKPVNLNTGNPPQFKKITISERIVLQQIIEVYKNK
jgi:hypothetical protein